MNKDIVLISGSWQKSVKDMQEVMNSIMGVRYIDENHNHIKVIRNKDRKKNPSKTNYKNKKNKW